MPEEPVSPPPVAPIYSAPPTTQASDPSTMDVFADKVGFVPNARKSDNVLQAKIIGVVVVISMAVTAIVGTTGNFGGDLLVGALIGLIAGVLISGLVIGIIGWKRK